MPTTPSGATVWRDYTTDGVPASGAHKVLKSQVRAWSTAVESLLDSVTSAAAIFDTRDNLFATLTYAANTLAWVVADSTAAYNGIYRKSGGSGTGSWSRVVDLPYSFVKMTDIGAGTANAIQVTSLIPTSASVMRVSNIFEANTGNVTISENGASAKSLLTNSGNQIAPGGLLAGMVIVYVDDGTSFRLLSDQVSAAIVAQAEAAQAAAEVAQAAAEAAAADAASVLASAFATVRVVDVSGLSVATAYEAGDTIDGVVLVTGDRVLRAAGGHAGQAANGIYVVPASGAASRLAAFSTYNAHVGILITVQDGVLGKSTTWLCSSTRGGTIGTTPLAFEAQGVPPASETVPGIARIASVASTLAGVDHDSGVSPMALASLVKAVRKDIADDTAELVGIQVGRSGIGLIVCHTSGHSAIFAWDSNPGVSIEKIAGGATSTDFTFTAGATWSGTTGTDGKFNIGISSAGDTLSFENRLGGAVPLTLYLLGA